MVYSISRGSCTSPIFSSSNEGTGLEKMLHAASDVHISKQLSSRFIVPSSSGRAAGKHPATKRDTAA